ADRNRSHWSTSKTPSYTKSVSWQHHHQDDIDNVITTQINAWAFNNQSILKERARQAIENPPKQPEQGTQHQVWVDDWIIDECLCAMYDASSESPGK
ncbi:hypothetical protein OFN94_10895, partial [Escherichia coli]|nr:hypothetical protein [Escherichia coli]